MDFSRKIFVRYADPKRKEMGPFAASDFVRAQDCYNDLYRWEGEQEWRPLLEIPATYDSEPASEKQRQRLRKHGVDFDESTVTRKQPRELYREVPTRKAAKEVRDKERERNERHERDALRVQLQDVGWNVADDVLLSELWQCVGSEPASASLVRTLRQQLSLDSGSKCDMSGRWFIDN